MVCHLHEHIGDESMTDAKPNKWILENGFETNDLHEKAIVKERKPTGLRLYPGVHVYHRQL